jgi:tRNA(Ile)-lysidine synthase
VASDLTSIAATIPAGDYAIGVSGGADSTALLTILAAANHLHLHVVHLNHETRGSESDADAEFVRALAERLNLPCTIAMYSQFAAKLKDVRNPSARFRKARLMLFRKVVTEHHLAGVLLAHHADDNAETVLHRLLRGSGAAGLRGMAAVTNLAFIRVFRPMLQIHRREVVQYLTTIHQPWREDESNLSSKYLRNRLRRILRDCPSLAENLIKMAESFSRLNQWTDANSSRLQLTFAMSELIGIPQLLARATARRWLSDRGCPPGDISPHVIDRLLAMCTDAATPSRAQFPGRILVIRRRGVISASPQ